MSGCKFLLLALMFVLGFTGYALNAGVPRPVPIVSAEKTGKERLGDKASDEQRVDNCKVPLERRGAKIRPASCNHLDAAPR
jgi:hypothetical protein